MNLLSVSNAGVRPCRHSQTFLLALSLWAGINGCSSSQSTGSRQRIQLKVGEIRDVSLPTQSTQAGVVELIGTSDNQEVVEVSRPQLAPAVDTLTQTNRNNTTVFQLKGITSGTANVVFSEKQPDAPGAGRTRKTYVVRVVSQ